MSDPLGPTYGVVLACVLLGAVGYGITIMQTYWYSTHFPADKLKVKITVYSLFVLDTLHVAFSWHMIYYYLVFSYGNPPALDIAVWSMNATFAATAVITIIAHSFYAHRVYILSHGNWIITAFILVMACARSVIGIFLVIKNTQLKTYIRIIHFAFPWLSAELGCGDVADISITISLVYYLRRRRTGMKRTDSILAMLSFYAVGNGLITSITSTLVLILAIAMPSNLVFFGVHLLLSKLYINSLLAVLNWRETQRDKDEAILSGWSKNMVNLEIQDSLHNSVTVSSSARPSDSRNLKRTGATPWLAVSAIEICRQSGSDTELCGPCGHSGNRAIAGESIVFGVMNGVQNHAAPVSDQRIDG